MGTSGLGSLLVGEGLLSETDRRTIKRTCGTQGPAFARGILAMGLLDEDELAAFLAERTTWRLAAKELMSESNKDAWGAVDRPLLERLEVLPLKLSKRTLHVAMVDPLDKDTIAQLEFFSGYKVHPVIATLSQIRKGLASLFKDYRPPSSQLEEFLTNHVASASRRLRLIDGGAGRGAAAATPAVPRMAESEVHTFEDDDDHGGSIASGGTDVSMDDDALDGLDDAPVPPKAGGDAANDLIELDDEVGAATAAPADPLAGIELDTEDPFAAEEAEAAGEAALAPDPVGGGGLDDADDLIGDDNAPGLALSEGELDELESSFEAELDDSGGAGAAKAKVPEAGGLDAGEELDDLLALEDDTDGGGAEAGAGAKAPTAATAASFDELGFDEADGDAPAAAASGGDAAMSFDDLGFDEADVGDAAAPASAEPGIDDLAFDGDGGAPSAAPAPAASDDFAFDEDDAAPAARDASALDGLEIDAGDDGAIEELGLGGGASDDLAIEELGIDDGASGTSAASDDLSIDALELDAGTSAASTASTASDDLSIEDLGLDSGTSTASDDLSIDELAVDAGNDDDLLVSDLDATAEAEAAAGDDDLPDFGDVAAAKPEGFADANDDLDFGDLDAGAADAADAEPALDDVMGDLAQAEPSPRPAAESPAPAAPDATPSHAAPFSPASAALNRALLGLTLAATPHDAVRRIAPALVAAGLRRGILIELRGQTARPLSAWDSRHGEVETRDANLGSFVAPGLGAALGRLYAGWSAFEDSVRGDTLKPFASWRDERTTLLAAMAPADSARSLVVVASWAKDAKDDATLRQVTSDIVRKLAQKLPA